MTADELALFDRLTARAAAGDAGAMSLLERIGLDAYDAYLATITASDHGQASGREAAATPVGRGHRRIAAILARGG